MKKIINLADFRQAFKNYGRENQFSYEGLETLFNHLEEYEEGTGEEIKLDVIALCCEYTEFENFEELQKEHDAETMKELENETIGRRVVQPTESGKPYKNICESVKIAFRVAWRSSSTIVSQTKVVHWIFSLVMGVRSPDHGIN